MASSRPIQLPAVSKVASAMSPFPLLLAAVGASLIAVIARCALQLGGGEEAPGTGEGEGGAKPPGSGEEDPDGQGDPDEKTSEGDEIAEKAALDISALDPLMVRTELLPLLTPRDLQRLRTTSKTMQQVVDDYVEKAGLVDGEGKPVKGTVPELLQGMVSGEYKRVPEWREEKRQWNKALDSTFDDLSLDEHGNHALAPEAHYDLLENWVEQIDNNGGDPEIEALHGHLIDYVVYLLEGQRLVVGGTWASVPANADPEQVLKDWSEGAYEWRQPKGRT